MATKIKVSNLSAEVNQHMTQIAQTHGGGGGTDSAQVSSIISTRLSSLNQSIIPDTNITYDLGSSTNRFRDLYLSGTTIDLGGTKISTNDSGDVRFLDGNNAPRKIVAKQLELQDSAGDNFRTVVSRGQGGGVSFVRLNVSTGVLQESSEPVDLTSNTTSNLTEGTNLYYTTTRANTAIDARVTKSYVDGLNINADTLDGQQGTYYLDWTNVTNKPAIPTFTVTGTSLFITT
jgi:hypothetical protein